VPHKALLYITDIGEEIAHSSDLKSWKTRSHYTLHSVPRAARTREEEEEEEEEEVKRRVPVLD